MVNLEEESKKLDNFMKKYSIGIFSFILFFIIFFVGIVLLSSESILSTRFIIWLSSSFLFFILGFYLQMGIGERNFVAYSLYKIAQGIEKNDLDQKYIYFLKRHLSTGSEKFVKKQKLIFEYEELKQMQFFKFLIEILEKINYSLNNNSLKDFDSELIEDLARRIYYQDRGIVELAGEINKQGSGKEPIPSLFSRYKNIVLSNWGLLIIITTILIFIAIFVYRYFGLEKETIVTSIVVLFAAAATIIFARKRN